MMGCGYPFLPFIGSERAGRDVNVNELSVSIVALVAHLSMLLYSALDYVLVCVSEVHSARLYLTEQTEFCTFGKSFHPSIRW